VNDVELGRIGEVGILCTLAALVWLVIRWM
jgi:hypothetical protein